MSPGNESPVKQFVTTQTLSLARALCAITTKPVTKYSCSKANLHTRPWKSGAVNEKQGGAGETGMEMLDKRSSGNPGSLGKAKMQHCLPVCSMTGCVCTQMQSGCVQRLTACPVLPAGNEPKPCCLEKGECDSAWRSSSHPASMPELLSSGYMCPQATSSGRRDVFIDTVPEQRQDAETYKLLILA